MNGRTHELVGLTACVMAFSDAPTREMVVGCLVALSASTLPDIDLVDNRKGKGIGMVAEVIKQSAIAIGFSIYYGADIYLIGVWIALMILMVLQPHRGLSHSIWMMGASAAVFVMMTDTVWLRWFLLAYASHLLLDLLNTKSVSILYPKGFCYGWVKAGGVADELIGALSGIALIIAITSRMGWLTGLDEAIKGVIACL